MILMAEPDIEVVGEAEDGAQAVEMAKRLKPDIAVLDISMPKVNGIEATRQIRATLPNTQTCLFSSRSGRGSGAGSARSRSSSRHVPLHLLKLLLRQLSGSIAPAKDLDGSICTCRISGRSPGAHRPDHGHHPHNGEAPEHHHHDPSHSHPAPASTVPVRAHHVYHPISSWSCIGGSPSAPRGLTPSPFVPHRKPRGGSGRPG